MRKETLSKTRSTDYNKNQSGNISVCVIPSKSLDFCLRRTNCSPGVFKLKLGQELFWTLSISAALKSLAIFSALALNAVRVRNNIGINDVLVDRLKREQGYNSAECFWMSVEGGGEHGSTQTYIQKAEQTNEALSATRIGSSTRH